MTRWPFHPPPHREEALTSWLNRLADANGVWLDEIIGSHLGSFTTGELDYRPPPLLVQDLHEKTGVQPDGIRSMTLTGWVPWLFDTLEDAAPDAFDTYLQGSVILAPGEARDRRVGPWRPWLPPEPLYRVCPDCLLSPGRGVTLLSQLPLMLSCPEHVQRLLPFYGVPGLPYAVTYEGPGEPVPAAVLALDALTQEGITTGVVSLPAREVHVGIWLRLLRTMIHELTAPTSRLRAGSLRSVRQVWDSIGRPNRRGSSRWRPYEQLSWESQQEILVAVAAGLELISTNQVPARGVWAHLLQQPLLGDDYPPGQPRAHHGGRGPATPADVDDRPSGAHIRELLEEAVDLAKLDRTAARQLYGAATLGFPHLHGGARAALLDLGIPQEFIPDKPVVR